MKKKIAFVSNSLTIGGVERVLVTLLNALDYDKYEVTLYLRQLHNTSFMSMLTSNVKVREWEERDTRRIFFSFIRKFQINKVLKSVYYRFLIRKKTNDWIYNEYYEGKIYSLSNQEKFDCVISFQGLYPEPLVIGLEKFDSPLKIAWIHGKANFNQQQKNLMKKLYQKYDHIFCVSKDIQKEFCNNFPEYYEKTSVFYNLLDRKLIEKQAEEKIDEELKSISIMTVGRISSPKGYLLIPKTVRLLKDAGYKIFWYIVGDGELRNQLEDEIKKYNVEEFVTLLGAKANPYPYIKNCNIYVQPSLSEGYCTTTMEAKILNKVVITTDVSGMREQFIHDKNGFIVTNMTSEALFDGIKKILDNPNIGKRFVDELSMEINDNHLELKKLYFLIQ